MALASPNEPGVAVRNGSYKGATLAHHFDHVQVICPGGDRITLQPKVQMTIGRATIPGHPVRVSRDAATLELVKDTGGDMHARSQAVARLRRVGRSAVVVRSGAAETHLNEADAVDVHDGDVIILEPGNHTFSVMSGRRYASPPANIQPEKAGDALKRSSSGPTRDEPSDRQLPSLDILRDTTIHVCLAGAGGSISSGMIGIWRRRLQHYGIGFSTSPPTVGSARPIIVVVDAFVSRADLNSWLRTARAKSLSESDCELHSQGWMVRCLQKAERLPASVEAWQPPEASSPRLSSGVNATPSRPPGSQPEEELAGLQTSSEAAWAAALAAGDAASRWGLPVGERPLTCPFTYEEIMEANASLIRQCPWLVVVVPPATGSSSVDSDASVSSNVPPAAGKKRRRTELEQPGPAPQTQPSNPFGNSALMNLNEHITSQLSPLLEAYEVTLPPEDEYRKVSLEHAIGLLRFLPYRVTRASQLRGMPGIGPKTLEKIDEILTTGKLGRTATLIHDPKVQTLMLFHKVLWVGPVTAAKWYSMGMRTLDDLRTAGSHLLNHQQRVGLERFDDLQHRVPREESDRVARIVKQCVESILPGSLCVLGGSYRRGQLTSSDFDFILSPPPPYLPCDLLPPLYRRLNAQGYLTDDLLGSWMKTLPGGMPVDDLHVAEGRGNEESSSPKVPSEPCGDDEHTSCSTYFGVWKEPDMPGAKHRRIDLKCFSAAQAPYALIAWTGNTPLNRSLRQYATNLGYEMDELSLLPASVKKAAMGHRSGKFGGSTSSFVRQLRVGSGVPSRCEYDVFSFLGLRFIPPPERNCFSMHADFSSSLGAAGSHVRGNAGVRTGAANHAAAEDAAHFDA